MIENTQHETPGAEEPKPKATVSLEISSIERSIIQAQVIEALQTCFDPEIPVNIYELGLIYAVNVSERGEVEVKMTLTSPHCPAAQSLPPEVQAKVKNVHGVNDATVHVVWEPTWTPALMSEAAKLELGML
jgi:FeS assembly SUF system protein